MRINQINIRSIHLVLMLLFYTLHSTGLIAQSSTTQVRGSVQSNNNEPLAGVSVIIKNTKTNFHPEQALIVQEILLSQEYLSEVLIPLHFQQLDMNLKHYRVTA